MKCYKEKFTECIAAFRLETKCTGEDLGNFVQVFESFHAAAMSKMKENTIKFLKSSNIDILSVETQSYLQQFDVTELLSKLKT